MGVFLSQSLSFCVCVCVCMCVNMYEFKHICQ